MRKVGGIIALTAGILGVCSAGLMLFVGGVGEVFGVGGMGAAIGMWWGGMAFSFLAIILGAVTMRAEDRAPGVLLVMCAIAGAFLGGPIVAVFMAFAAAGGMMALLGKRKMATPQKMIRSESRRIE